MVKKRKIGTRAIHVGEEGIKPEQAHTFPIFPTGTFVFENIETAAATMAGKKEGWIYARLGGPNQKLLEEKIASLERAEDAVIFSSGMAAINTVIQNLARKNGHVICTQTLYGCTDELFANFLPDLGIEFSFVNTSQPENVRKAIKKNTKVVFLETPANPTLDLADIKKISEIAHKYNISVVVDNSFATPYNQRPLTLGADVIIQSVTKYLNGHGDLILGAAAGKKSFIRGVKQSLRHWADIMGPTPSVFDCWLACRGLKTFELRMERHNSNALKLAGFLENHPAVKRVIYPGLKSHLQYKLAERQMITESGSPGFSGMIAFELTKGGEKAIKCFLENLNIAALAVSLGYIETLIEVPSLMTHALVPRKERLEKGITDDMIRLSVGIENYEDLQNAFEEALDSLRKN